MDIKTYIFAKRGAVKAAREELSWKKIKDETITAVEGVLPESYTVDKDENGKPFAVSEMCLVLEFPSVVEIPSKIRGYINYGRNDEICIISMDSTNICDSEQMLHLKFGFVPPYIDVIKRKKNATFGYLSSSGGFVGSPALSNLEVNGEMVKEVRDIRIIATTAGAVLPEGTRITTYGRN